MEMFTPKVYIAGPMRGIPLFNFPAFHLATKRLREMGYQVFNPAEHDMETYGADISKGNITGDEEKAVKDFKFNLRETLLSDLTFICQSADAVIVLSGWESSRGARVEVALAEALNIPVIPLKEIVYDLTEL